MLSPAAGRANGSNTSAQLGRDAVVGVATDA